MRVARRASPSELAKLSPPPQSSPLVKRVALATAASALLLGCGAGAPGEDVRPSGDSQPDSHSPPMPPPPMPPPVDVIEPIDAPEDVPVRPMVDAFVEDRPIIPPMPPPRDE
jgi:hypothetical protein